MIKQFLFFYLLFAILCSVLTWRHADILFKLFHKKRFIIIAAQRRYFFDGIIAHEQKMFSMFHPASDDILNKRVAKIGFIQFLKIRRA